MSTLEGQLLVAPPGQSDPDFHRCVILLIQHSDQQAFGVVLNRPGNTTLGDLFPRAYDANQCVYSGGPAPGPVMAVHACESLGEIQVLDAVYYSVKRKNLEKLVREADYPTKVFDSHSGWGPGQLETQIERGDWKVVAGTTADVFSEEADLWDQISGRG